MVTKQTLDRLELEDIQEYFQYIIESKLNGQHAQAKELFENMTKGMQGQRAAFFHWYETTYYYEAQDNDEMEELMAFREYFKD